MLFNSYEFIFLFLPGILALFFFVGRWSASGAASVLTAASIFFYGWWSIGAVPLLLASIAFNFALGNWITSVATGSGVRSKILLAFGVTMNLFVLGVFKYANFFLDSAGVAARWVGVPWAIESFVIVLPVGISFYTFTQVAFLVDCWQGKVRETNFLHYVLFVSFFPHLIAGPILHHAQLMPQFARDRTYRADPQAMSYGLSLFVIGLSKKVLLADPLGQYADLVFNAANNTAPLNGVTAWLGVIAYALQIYFDFSGYSDMAIGISACFGITLPDNFRSPYKATSIIDFWRRWHISLSTFLRDYLYVPLGGNRRGEVRRFINIGLTMLLGGLWHGASWTFVLWGAVHGTALIANHAWTRTRWHRRVRGRCWHVTSWILTFAITCVAWALFRATNLNQAITMVTAMFGMNGFALSPFLNQELPFKQSEFYRLLVAGLIIAVALPTARDTATRLVNPASWRRIGIWGALASATIIMGLLTWSVSRVGSHNAFLYFQF